MVQLLQFCTGADMCWSQLANNSDLCHILWRIHWYKSLHLQWEPGSLSLATSQLLTGARPWYLLSFLPSFSLDRKAGECMLDGAEAHFDSCLVWWRNAEDLRAQDGTQWHTLRNVAIQWQLGVKLCVKCLVYEVQTAWPLCFFQSLCSTWSKRKTSPLERGGGRRELGPQSSDLPFWVLRVATIPWWLIISYRRFLTCCRLSQGTSSAFRYNWPCQAVQAQCNYRQNL